MLQQPTRSDRDSKDYNTRTMTIRTIPTAIEGKNERRSDVSDEMEPNCSKERREKKTKIRANEHGRARESTESLTENTVVVTRSGPLLRKNFFSRCLFFFAIAKSFSDRLQKLVWSLRDSRAAGYGGWRAGARGRGRRTEKRKCHGPTDLTDDGDGRTDAEERIDDRGGGRTDGQMEGREGDRQLPGLHPSVHCFSSSRGSPFLLTLPVCLPAFLSPPCFQSFFLFSALT